MINIQEHQTSYPIIAQRQLKNIRKLGAGSFADVWLCWYTPEDGSPKYKVAAKYVKPEILSNEVELELFLKEVDTLKHLKHRYIVHLIGVGAPAAAGTTKHSNSHAPADPAAAAAAAAGKDVAADATAAAGGPFASYLQSQVLAAEAPKQVPLFLVQEYLAGGALSRVVAAEMIKGPWQRHCYTLADSTRWAVQIAEALVYLHSRESKVIHRDLKLSNILLSSTNHSTAEARVADFGLHACVPQHNQPLLALNSSQVTLSIPHTAHNSQDNSTHSHGGVSHSSNADQAPSGQPGCTQDPDLHPEFNTCLGVKGSMSKDPSRSTQILFAEAGRDGTPDSNARTVGTAEAAAANLASSTAHTGSVPVSAADYLRVQSAKLLYQRTTSVTRLRVLANRTLSAPRLGVAVTSVSSSTSTSQVAVGVHPATSAALPPEATAALHALIDESCKDALRRKGTFGRSFRQQYGQLLRAQMTHPSTVEESMREGTSKDSSAVGGTEASTANTTATAAAAPAGGVSKDDSAFEWRGASGLVLPGLGTSRAALSTLSSITVRSRSGVSSGASITSSAARDNSATSRPPLDSHTAAQAAVAKDAGDVMADAVFQLTARTGSLVYMAPEVFLGKSYNEKADVYSFGIMLYELLHHQLLQLSIGAVANDGQAALHLYAVSMAEEGYRPPVNPRLHQGLQDLIRACWAQQPEDRPSMSVVLERLRIQQALGFDGNSSTAAGNQHSQDEGSACCSCLKT